MGGGTRRTRRRRWIALTIAGSIVVVAVGVVIGVRSWLTAEPREVGVEETVESFRDDAEQVTALDGVYVYDTTGTESIDVLGGDSHTYPAETALTVTTEGCGVRMTWKPLAGRSESWLVCPLNGGWVTPRTNSVHSFFRQTYDTAFVCDTDTWWAPPQGMSSWTSSCGNADRTSTRTGRIVGVEPYVIDGETRDAVHAEWLDSLSRGSDGTVATDIWIDTETGLMLGQRVTTHSHNDSVVGKVAFEEQLALHLRSLVPKR
jgi:hypothetical protein